MEERVPPHPSSSPSLPHPHPHHHHETYVVQIPKDQIYRVPPPENALIVERYRKPSISKTNTRGSYCCCCGWVCCAVLTVVVVLLLVGLAVAVNLFGKAHYPTFHVESFHVRNATGGNEFDFTLTSSNPNKYSDVVYKQGGASSLAFRGMKIASGKFPAFLQDRKSSSDVRIVLHSSGGKSPPEITTAMSSKRKGQPKLSFTLKVTVTARMNTGFLRQGNVDLSVSCDYAVDKLTGGTNILSEECAVKHG